MKSLFKKDWPLFIIALLPLAYLATIWGKLPESVPMHWDINGEIDRYGNKAELLILIFVPLLIYGLFLIIPKIDPKNKLNEMGNKLHSIRFVTTAITSALMLVVLLSVKNESLANFNYIILAIGVLFASLGNYFQTIKPNYFVGIRTPWTLENETVWKKTHILGGRLWFAGGMVVVLLSLLLSHRLNLIIFLVITAIITIVPIVYSYLKFQELKEEPGT
jgi:uncharacterized membrane protein